MDLRRPLNDAPAKYERAGTGAVANRVTGNEARPFIHQEVPMARSKYVTGGIVASIIAATIGAVLLLVILRLVNRGGRW